MTSKCKHRVTELPQKIRFSDYVIKYFPILPSNKAIKKAIKSGTFQLNGKTALTGMWVTTGDIIEFNSPDKNEKRIYEIELDIVFEDNHLAVINKPAGIPVNGHYFRTVENALPFNLSIPEKQISYFKPRPVHRLDSQTSGLLLIAKSHEALIHLSRQFENSETEKEYIAIVHGLVEEKGEINSPIDGRNAISIYEPMESVPSLKNEYLTLMKLTLLTGRTHQLRIHMSIIGHPIVGDKMHGDESTTFTGKGLFLSSIHLKFKHPENNKEMEFTIDRPEKFVSLLKREKRRWEKHMDESNDTN